MPRGQPDYGVYQQKTVGATLADMGELAARLGSIDSYDRRGDVVFLDDFEAPILKWETAVAGTEYVILDNESVKSGSQAAKIHVAAVAFSNPDMHKSVFSLGSARQGAEFHFSKIENTYTIEFHLIHYDGTNFHWGEIHFNNGTGELRVTGLVGAGYIVASGLVLPSLDHCYIPLKFVTDHLTGKYVRVLFGGVEYDISAFNLATGLDGRAPQDFVRIEVMDAGGAIAADLWVEDFILTINEP